MPLPELNDDDIEIVNERALDISGAVAEEESADEMPQLIYAVWTALGQELVSRGHQTPDELHEYINTELVNVQMMHMG